MSSQFSNFQIAVLQQMGLTVWQSQDSARPAVTEHSNSGQAESKQPLVESKRESAQDRLAGLRKSMADSPNSSANNDSASHEASTDQVAKLDVTSLSQDAKQILSDIKCAIEMLNLSTQPIWYQADTLSVDTLGVYFPGAPDALSAQEKRQLWAKLNGR